MNEHRIGGGSGDIVIRRWPRDDTKVARVQIHTWPAGYGPNITRPDQLRHLGDQFRDICHELADTLEADDGQMSLPETP